MESYPIAVTVIFLEGFENFSDYFTTHFFFYLFFQTSDINQAFIQSTNIHSKSHDGSPSTHHHGARRATTFHTKYRERFVLVRGLDEVGYIEPPKESPPPRRRVRLGPVRRGIIVIIRADAAHH